MTDLTENLEGVLVWLNDYADILSSEFSNYKVSEAVGAFLRDHADTLRAMTKDAERYRFLRAPENEVDVSNMIMVFDHGNAACLPDGEQLDAAIDSAMKESAK